MAEAEGAYTVKRLAAEAELHISTVARRLRTGRINGAQAFPRSPWRIPAAEARRVISAARGERALGPKEA